MDLETEAGKLAAEIRHLGANTRGRRIPAALRKRIFAHASGLVAAGATRASVCATLGVSAQTLKRWGVGGRKRKPSALPAAAAFLPLRVADNKEQESGVVVHGPGGVRIAGLSLPQIAELLRLLS